MYKKVLIISHNPITTYHAMGKTFLTMFSSFKEEELCQLYIYPTIPDIKKCSSYYRITDKDILKSYFKFKVGGGEIDKSHISESNNSMFEIAEDEQLYRNPKNKKPIMLLARDLMWLFSGWFNKELKDWLTREKPTCIFVAPGKSKFLYNIALKISKYLDIPIVTYICDEYYFVKTPKALSGKIQVKLLQKKIEKLMLKTSHIITICNSLKDLYSNRFNIPATTVMTGSNTQIYEKVKSNKSRKVITYMGNIGYNRFLSLKDIGLAIDKFNSNYNTDIKLDIYTPTTNPDILSHFDGINSINLKGFVTGEEFIKTFNSAKLLLHTESFDKTNIELVKNSVSTKIADSLASGICLLAYGPREVASMRHLIDNDCALIATNKDELEQMLYDAYFNDEKVYKCVENALIAAKKYHSQKTNSEIVYKIMENINETSSS